MSGTARLFLLLANLALIAAVWRGFMAETAPLPGDPSRPAASAASPVITGAPAAETRPAPMASLFRSARRPEPATAPTPPPSETVAAPDVRLLGIVVGSGEALAVLGRTAEGPPLRLRLSEEIDGWRLAEVARKAVVLERGGARHVIPLDLPDRGGESGAE
jgi:hypothetical protein